MSILAEEIFPRLQLVSVSQKARMDCETPVSLYLKHASECFMGFILESAEQGVQSGRYSFIGWDPLLTITYDGTTLRLTGSIDTKIKSEKPFEFVKKILNRIELLDCRSVPNARGGFVGYISYDSVRAFENIGKSKCGPSTWFNLFLPKKLLIFDHLNHCVEIICHEVGAEDVIHSRMKAEVELKKILTKTQQFSVSNTSVLINDSPISLDNWSGKISKAQFCELVNTAKREILEGEIFQVVLSRAIERAYLGDPLEIYRALRQINPSPYMYFLKLGKEVVVGGSPEALITVENGIVTTKPIAGTRWRGKSLEEDQQLELDLLSDAKECAEHVMLVDLGRNDLGRVAEPGTVSVPHFMQVERFSHVMHIVSIVKAKLKEDIHPLDALMSAFPAGTLTGAPKIRAMQIINNLEIERRGVYGGAICFIDFSGNLDSCIAIRTATILDGVVRCQAGAGIVADSNPENEFNETNLKLMSMVTAVERAISIQGL